MLSINIYEENTPIQPLDKSIGIQSTQISPVSKTSEELEKQRFIDEEIKKMTKGYLSRDQSNMQIPDSLSGSDPHTNVSSRRSRRTFWKNFYGHAKAWGFVAVHILGVIGIKQLSYHTIQS
jgi:hypothetical protein